MSLRPFTHKIEVTIDGKPAALIVARDLQTSSAALFLNLPVPCAIALSPEAHADLLQALSFPPAARGCGQITSNKFTRRGG